MKILIIVAMDKELKLLTSLLNEREEKRHAGYRYLEGTCESHRIVCMKSGIGKVNAALAASKLIEFFNPDLVINTGVAGGISVETHPLDIVVGKETCYHDVWCGPGTEYGEASGCPRRFKGSERALSTDALRERREGDRRILHATIATGDIFISRPEEVEKIVTLYPDCKAADMESAAIAQTCYLTDKEFISIRVISDTPGSEENISQYETFWDDAPAETFSILSSLLKEL